MVQNIRELYQKSKKKGNSKQKKLNNYYNYASLQVCTRLKIEHGL